MSSTGSLAITPAAAALWQYSLRLYAVPGISAACLRLQDEAGADVNMIFLLLFAARSGLQLSAVNVATVEQECKNWHATVIEPLRQVRRLIKNDQLRAHCDVYQQVKRAELLAEQRHQFALAASLDRITERAPRTSPLDAARMNLDNYAPLQKAPPDAVASLMDAYTRDLSAPP